MGIIPESISTYGADIDFIFWLVTALVGFWSILSLAVLTYSLIRFRKSKSPKAQYLPGEGWKHNRWIEVPHLLVLACDGVIIFFSLIAWNHIEINMPAADVRVGVQGRMWNWVYRYPGPDNIMNSPDDVIVDAIGSELHVPVNKNVVVELTAKDVLHSFFVKELRLKQDAVPGRSISKWFNAVKPGKYPIICAQLCGYDHSKMRNFLVVDTEEDYDRYIKTLYKEATRKVAQK